MSVLLPLIGTVLVLTALIDVFLTVLHPRAESNLLSIPVAKVVWRGFRWLAKGPPKRRDRILSYGGPTILVTLISVWVGLLLLGFALIIWPALGTGIQVEQGETSTDFATALYYSGFSLSTLGTGDLVPQTAFYRLLIVLKSLLGFSVFTLVLSYVLSVYGALTQRNIFALSLHHRTASTADSAVLLARLASGNEASLYQEVSNIAKDLTSLLEFNNSYPLLLYFRYHQSYYALPRVVYLTIDIATLINSALDADQYRALAKSSGTAELWCGGMHLMREIDQSIDSGEQTSPQESAEPLWQEHYYHALETLSQNGIKTTDAPTSGAKSYLSMRQQWEPCLAKLIKYMDYQPSQIYS